MPEKKPNQQPNSTGNLYAQASKGFVEIVRADSPPVVQRSFLKRTYYDNWLGRRMIRKVPVISFETSGKVLKQFTTRQFGTLTGHTLKPSTVWELDSHTISKLSL